MGRNKFLRGTYLSHPIAYMYMYAYSYLFMSYVSTYTYTAHIYTYVYVTVHLYVRSCTYRYTHVCPYVDQIPQCLKALVSLH